MSCAKTPIDDTAWPQFTRPALFQHVILKYCVPPKAPATYITALQRLNVTVLNKLVLNNLPANTNITRASLADLPSHVTSLELKATASSLQLEFDTLDGLEQLRVLDLCRVRPGRLPPHLKKLRLFYSNMRTLPSPLNDLESLFVHDGAQVDVPPLATLSKLQVLNLAVPLQVVPPLSQTLVNVTMTMFEVRSPVPFTHSDCAHVQQLTIEYWWMAQVPAGWVAACPVLHTLKLHLQKNLTELAKGMLNGTTELRVLYINACPLKTLPVDLFEYSPNLKEANLSGNKLLYLPK
ncbi:unnamed protein product [Diatraea saccharalis]|uniref:Uncharacterized protein n=1 Tax=Diatraea saccharalis TaxID=40085 RepID=A0A9N9WC92_9NEOP|nr:unnamed protein product [Diatraea saccharalis]